jgi:hypothetical protein
MSTEPSVTYHISPQLEKLTVLSQLRRRRDFAENADVTRDPRWTCLFVFLSSFSYLLSISFLSFASHEMSTLKPTRDLVLKKIKAQLLEHDKSRPDDDHEEKEDWEVWGQRFVTIWVSFTSSLSSIDL